MNQSRSEAEACCMQTRSLIWNVGYFVSSIGLNEGQIKRYIDWQDKKESRPQTTRLF